MVASLQYLWVTSVLWWGSTTSNVTMPGAPSASSRPRRYNGYADGFSSGQMSTGFPGWCTLRPYLQPGTRMSDLMVCAEGVRKHFGRLEVLRGIDLEVRTGEVLCIIGPSGSGKSTFLRCINHLEKIDEGRLTVDGELVGYREHAGRLYELRDLGGRTATGSGRHGVPAFQPLPHMTAIENVIVGPVKVKHEDKAKAVKRAWQLLDRVGLGEKATFTHGSCRVASSRG